MRSSSWHLETRLIHDPGPLPMAGQETLPPIVMSTAFGYDSAEAIERVFASHEPGYLYSRISNPTVAAFENRMAALEGGIGAVATASGMSALAMLILGLAGVGDRIAASPSLFGGTYSLLNETVARWGITLVVVDPRDLPAVREALNPPTRLMLVETIGNPRLDVPDLRRLADLVHAAGLPLAVDSTLTTPALLTPRTMGADLIIHSASKFINGHGTAIGGILVDAGTYPWGKQRFPHLAPWADRFGPYALLAWLRTRLARDLGACLSPVHAFLFLIGLETLALRMDRHCANALAIARFLQHHPAVRTVTYPGLDSHPDHVVAREQFGHRFGALLTLRLGTRDRCFRFISRLRLIRCVTNLGDTRTLVIHPASTFGREFDPATQRLLGIEEDLVRISVGIEEVDDIREDLEQALNAL